MSRFFIALMFFVANVSSAAQELTTDAVYESFNLRSIYSSYGPRLKYFCQSYLKEFFPSKHIVSKTAAELTLDNGDDVWTIRIIGKNRISVGNVIKKGTYRSMSEYDVHFRPDALDWWADETALAIPGNCVTYDANIP